jgi:hypothetical protein
MEKALASARYAALILITTTPSLGFFAGRSLED